MRNTSHKSKLSEDAIPSQHNAPILNSSWKALFFFTTRKHVGVLVVGCIFALLAGCVTPVLAVLLGDVFNAFTSFGAGQIDSDDLHRRIIQSCFAMVGLGAAGWFLNGAYFLIFVAFGELQAASIRSKAFVSGIQAYVHHRKVKWEQ